MVVSPVVPRKKVCDYCPKVPLRPRKLKRGESIQRQVCLLLQLGSGAHNAVDVATGAENFPPKGGMVHISHDI